MAILRVAILHIAILLLSTPQVTSHKNQFRVLGLQYATLNQRFELEIKLLHDELDSTNTDIKDLKGDNARIIKMFEIFTTEVQELRATLSYEQLKFQSLEKDFKALQNDLENFKAKHCEICISDEAHNKTRNGLPLQMSSVSSENDTGNKGKSSIAIYSSDEDDDNHDDRKTGGGGSHMSAKWNISSNHNTYLFAAKFGEEKACFVNVNNRSLTNCVTHLGDGVRAVAVDTKMRILYWSDDHRKLILSSALNGSDEMVIARNVTTLGLGLDVSYQVLFYTNVSGDIFRKSLTDDQTGIVWTNVGEKPRRVYIDQTSKILYAITNQWTGIVSINYLTNHKEMVVGVQGRIKSLVVDATNQMLYFSVNSSIYVKDLVDKTVFVIHHGSSIPSDLIIYGDYMYVVYYYLNKIDIMDLKTRYVIHTVYTPWVGRGNTVSLCLLPGM